MRTTRDAMPVILLGARLKELRKQSGLTQQAVSDQIQVDRTTYTKYENGRVCPDQQGLVSLAELFGVTVDYLLGREEKPDAPMLTDGNEDAPLLLSPDEKMLIQLFRILTPEEREELTKAARQQYTDRRDIHRGNTNL